MRYTPCTRVRSPERRYSIAASRLTVGLRTSFRDSLGDLAPGRPPCPKRAAGRRGPARARVFRAPAGPRRHQPDGQLRDQRAPRLTTTRHVYRGACSGDRSSHLRLPAQRRYRRPALHGQRHARPVRPGPAHRARSPRREQCGDGDPARRRLHSNTGDFAGHPRLQPGPQGAPRGWHRDYAVSQSTRGRRLQVQPTEWRPCRPGGDAMG